VALLPTALAVAVSPVPIIELILVLLLDPRPDQRHRAPGGGDP
jgi:hypothetical protein